MRRPALKLTMLLVVVYLVTLIAFFPASLAIRWFMPAVPGLAHGAANGTIWNGQINSVEYSGWNVGNLAWNLHPAALLALRLQSDVQIRRNNAAPVDFSISATPDGAVDISNLTGTLTLAELEQARLMPRNIASGEILVDLAELGLLNGRPVAANGKIGLVNLTSRLLPGIELGSYEGEITTRDNVITASFRDVDAPLRVSGTGSLQPEGRYSASGSITPTSETPEALRRGLMLLGQPDATGRYNFNFSGQL